MAEHAADEHGRRSDHIITAVLRRGAQGGRADAAAQSAAEQRHPQLHKNGSAEDGKAQSPKYTPDLSCAYELIVAIANEGGTDAVMNAGGRARLY